LPRNGQGGAARWRRIDALVNNAGVTKFVKAADLDRLSAEDFQHLLD
jgi:NADP-dependent 3-hydroxy acid dehydrogenase YdfG